MAKPRPVPAMVTEEGNHTLEVIKVPALFAVFHADSPVTLIGRWSGGCRKYDLPAYSSAAMAHSKARALNRLFNTDEFTVWRLEPIEGPLTDTKK